MRDGFDLGFQDPVVDGTRNGVLSGFAMGLVGEDILTPPPPEEETPVDPPSSQILINFAGLTGQQPNPLIVDGYEFLAVFSSAILNVYAAAQGFSQEVIHSQDWLTEIYLTKSGGGTFDLISFDYAGSLFGDSSDGRATAFFADTSTTTAGFVANGKNLQTLTVNWTNLTKVEFMFDEPGGATDAFGSLSNFVLES